MSFYIYSCCLMLVCVFKYIFQTWYLYCLLSILLYPGTEQESWHLSLQHGAERHGEGAWYQKHLGLRLMAEVDKPLSPHWAASYLSVNWGGKNYFETLWVIKWYLFIWVVHLNLFLYILTYFSPQTLLWGRWSIISPLLQMRKLRHKEFQ